MKGLKKAKEIVSAIKKGSKFYIVNIYEPHPQNSSVNIMRAISFNGRNFGVENTKKSVKELMKNAGYENRYFDLSDTTYMISVSHDGNYNINPK